MRKSGMTKKRLWKRFKPAVVDPRYRYRTRRRGFRVTGAALLLLAGAYGVAAGYGGMQQSRWFAVEQVEIEGLRSVPRAEVESHLSEMGVGPAATLFDVDLAAVRDRLQAHPWIREVHVRKSFPNRLAIGIIEREPVAVVQEGKSRALVDESGAVLAELDESPPAWTERRWPTLVGISLASLNKKEARAREAFLGGMRLLEIVRLDEPDRGEPVRVDMSRPHDVVLEWMGYRILLGERSGEAAWRRFQSVVPDMIERKKNAREIDLRFPNQIIVR
jgi:hypothetical protein